MRATILAAVAGLAGGSSIAVLAQNAPGPHQDNSGLNGSLSHEDLQKLSGDHKQDSSDMPQDPVLARAKAKAQSIPLLQSLQIGCEVSDAKLVVAGTSRPRSGGKEVETRVYEVACSGAMGYVLETQGSDQPMAISCLSAEEARCLRGEGGASFICKLPANKDVNGMVASMIAADARSVMQVRTLQLFGRSASFGLYRGGARRQGIHARMAQPGSTTKNTAVSCTDAAKHGIKCKLTDTEPAELPVTLQRFKEALAQNGVSCNIGQIRLVGQEDHLKRYVVEYVCADQSTDRVAFLPLAGNATPYESLDCTTALSTRGVACTLTPVKYGRALPPAGSPPLGERRGLCEYAGEK
jgi:hypothetical protein